MQRTRIKRKRSRTRRGQATRSEVSAVRLAVYQRAQGLCELGLHPECSRTRVLPYEGGLYERGHLAHLKAKRRYGTSELNCVWSCWRCHLIELHNPKPCPKKEQI